MGNKPISNLCGGNYQFTSPDLAKTEIVTKINQKANPFKSKKTRLPDEDEVSEPDKLRKNVTIITKKESSQKY